MAVGLAVEEQMTVCGHCWRIVAVGEAGGRCVGMAMVGKAVVDKFEEVESRGMRMVGGSIDLVSRKSWAEDMSGSLEVR